MANLSKPSRLAGHTHRRKLCSTHLHSDSQEIHNNEEEGISSKGTQKITAAKGEETPRGIMRRRSRSLPELCIMYDVWKTDELAGDQRVLQHHVPGVLHPLGPFRWVRTATASSATSSPEIRTRLTHGWTSPNPDTKRDQVLHIARHLSPR